MDSNLHEATKFKLMEAFAQLDGGLAQIERRLEYLEKTVEDVEMRTDKLQEKIQISTIDPKKGTSQE